MDVDRLDAAIAELLEAFATARERLSALDVDDPTTAVGALTAARHDVEDLIDAVAALPGHPLRVALHTGHTRWPLDEAHRLVGLAAEVSTRLCPGAATRGDDSPTVVAGHIGQAAALLTEAMAALGSARAELPFFGLGAAERQQATTVRRGLPADLREELERRASAEGRSVADVHAAAVRAYLRDSEGEPIEVEPVATAAPAGAHRRLTRWGSR